jgi:hypothetical protein
VSLPTAASRFLLVYGLQVLAPLMLYDAAVVLYGVQEVPKSSLGWSSHYPALIWDDCANPFAERLIVRLFNSDIPTTKESRYSLRSYIVYPNWIVNKQKWLTVNCAGHGFDSGSWTLWFLLLSPALRPTYDFPYHSYFWHLELRLSTTCVPYLEQRLLHLWSVSWVSLWCATFLRMVLLLCWQLSAA